jgi:hypothetical protein
LCSRETVVTLMVENGPVEMSTAMLYAAGGVLVWLLRTRAMDWRLSLALSITLFAFAARELDLHKYWTGTSVLKLSFYLQDAPLHQKITAAAAMAIVIAAIVRLVPLLRPLWSAFWRREVVAITLVVFLATMAFTKVLDRVLNILAEDYDVPVTLETRTLFMSLEELTELGLPILAILALAQNRRLQDSSVRS